MSRFACYAVCLCFKVVSLIQYPIRGYALKSVNEYERNAFFKQIFIVLGCQLSSFLASGLPWVPEVFLARFPVSVTSLLRPARKTSGAERDFFESAEPMTSQFKST